MKKTNSLTVVFHKRRAVKRMIRYLSWKAWKKNKRGAKDGERVVIFRDGKSFRAYAKNPIPMPKVFCLTKNKNETLNFINGIWDDILRIASTHIRNKRKQPISQIVSYLDFKTIEFISAPAALILASLFDRAKFINGHKLYTIDEYKWNSSVAATLREIGFHKLLEMQPVLENTFDMQGLVIQKFLTGKTADSTKTGWMQEKITELLPEDLKENFAETIQPYNGMFEAILNSHNWAYPDTFTSNFKILPNWWLTAAVDTNLNKVTICVFDQGVSIPRSLPNSDHGDEFRVRLKKILNRVNVGVALDDPQNDGLAITLATKIARSATQLPQHGKGLRTMLEVAQRAKHAKLRIISRNGEYVWETGRGASNFVNACPIRGTLVEWQLEL